MALTGSFSGKTANERITPTIIWRAEQSVVGNYSDITATLTYRRDNDYTTGGTWEGALTIGSQTATGKKFLKITNDADAVAITAQARVFHDDAGALTVTIAASGAISGSTLTSTTVSAEITLPTIARAASISASDANIGSRATVVIGRKSDSFTHSIAYRFGALSGYVDAEGNPVDTEVKMTASTVNFLLPEGFYGQIPNAPSGVCTLTCRTYAGSTQIGSAQTGEFTVTAGYALSRPVVSGTVRDGNPATVALTGDDSVLVQYASVARCRIDAQARNGAAVTALRIGGVTVQGDTVELENPAFDTLVFEATDSRGYTTAYTAAVPRIPYVPLTNNATVRRTDPTSGNAVLTLQGSCWKGSFGAAENSLTATVQVNQQEPWEVAVTVGEDHKYEMQVALSDLAYDVAHTVTVTVRDQVMSAQQTLSVHRGIPVFDWGEADFQFHVPVAVPALTVDGVSLEAYIAKQLES